MQMLRAQCVKCGWVYDCVTLPMLASPACLTMIGQSCPMCGNQKDNTVADPRDLTEEERAHKIKAMALEAM